jgi:subtilisin family serine protease
MSVSRRLVLSILVLSLGPAAPAEPGGVLRVEDFAGRAVDVAPWDPTSPQRLVRIDGVLYQQETGRYFPVIPDRVSVRLADGVGTWDELVERAAATAPATFSVLRQLIEVRTNRLGIVDLEVPDGGDPVDWCDLVHRTGLARYAEVATRGEYLATPTDPRYSEQWGLNNIGQTAGIPGADIDAEDAWDLVTGDPTIVVAVLDSGTDIDHEDLAANVWHNPGEIPDNGVDDDANGYIDDWEGWDFDDNDNDPRATYYHGTFVTGIVNAAGNNGVGITGVAGGLGSAGVQGMALGVGNNSPDASVVDDAILYAADNGADVITMSLSIAASQAIDDALVYAYNAKDVFIDGASGNNGSSVAYPATRPEVMAVAATDDDDTVSWFSNPGPEVEVAAPGSGILSTNLGNTYSTDDGTSFAAPHVAGLAALILSRNPGMSAPDVRQLIIDTAEDVAAPGFDYQTGHGRINAYEAVLRAATSDGLVSLREPAYACQAVLDPTVSDIDLAGSGSVQIVVTSDTETAGETVTLAESGASTGVFHGTLSTDTGAPAPDGILQVSPGDTIVAEYIDADDGMGGTGVSKTVTATVDCDAPLIFDVGEQDQTDVSTSIVWSTDEPASSVVRYGPATPPTTPANGPGPTLQHSVGIGGLTECTTYFYEVESADEQGNVVVDDNGGAYHSFETYRNLPETGPVPCHQGQVVFDSAEPYGCNAGVTVTVIDIDLDTDPGVAEAVDVLLTSSSETVGEWITLTEIALSNSRFQGTITLTSGPVVPGDGLLSVGPGDLVTATYHDADDGIQGAFTAIGTTTTDCTPPAISNVRVVQITGTRAVVAWNTDEPATSRVEFGDTAALGSLTEDPTLKTSHTLDISPFDPCDRAYFRVASADANGDLQVVDAGGAPFEFNLMQIGGLVWFETFESPSGWTLTGEWERGTPQGLGTSNADPVEAWSGAFSIGNDLAGQGSFAGDYEPSALETATSPVFSTRQERDLELIIRRKLGVTAADEASVHILTNGSDQVWTSGGTRNDGSWVVQTTSISAFADNKSSVQIEFRLESLDASHSFGWNVDEVIVKDSTQPDYLDCGGCAGPPSFAGASAVSDPDPCGPGGLLVQWQQAASWGTGGGGTYEVYRDTSASFVPSAANRVASGLTGTSWTDTAAPVDAPVWYVVRARNDESCSADGGLDDGNLARVPGTETTSQSLPTPVGNTVVADTVGEAHVRLAWDAVAGADHYIVRRGTLPDVADAMDVGTTTATTFEDVGTAADNESYGYQVVAVDACGREE